ncbi:MAG: SIR2 family NAD-dependent protein deacylase [Acutalibacteraceae bacterium]
MFSRMWITKSTENYWQQIDKLKNEIKTADAVLIGAGAGLSTSAGLTYSGERFMKYFFDFHQKYGINDMYSGGFYPFETLEEYWAWWSRHIYYNRYDTDAGKVYLELLKLAENKEYFVLTTNVDHQFQLAGFDKQRLFYTQGDYGLWQCSEPCHQKTYDNEEAVRKMLVQQNNMRIPTELIPHCPKCGRPMTMNLRCDDTFVQDEGWYAAANRYQDFISRYRNSHILLLELGVGMNTPVIIKYPFWRMTSENPNAVYCSINLSESICPTEIKAQSICISDDINCVLNDLNM